MSLIYRDFDEVTFSNTAATNTIFKFDFDEFRLANKNYNGEILGPNQAVRITIAGLAVQNVGAGTPTLTFGPYLGSTFMGGFIVDVPTGGPFFKLTDTLMLNTGRNEVFQMSEVYFGDQLPMISDNRMGINVAKNISTSIVTNNVYKLDATLSVASANFTITKKIAMIEFI